MSITCRYSRRRNTSRTTGLCDGLSLGDLHVGMAVKSTRLSGGRALIVGPIPEEPGEEPPVAIRWIKRIAAEIENEVGSR